MNTIANEQTSTPQQEMPTEFYLFMQVVSRRQEGSTLDEKIDGWAHMHTAWKEYLSSSPHRAQALQLLLPILDNYGSLCYQRYLARGQREDLMRALQVLYEAVQKTPVGTKEILKRLEGLGAAQGLHYSVTQMLGDLDTVIQTWERACTLTKDPAEQAKYLYTLGQCYKERYRHTRRLIDLARAIQSLETAVQQEQVQKLFEPLFLLGQLFRERFLLTKKCTDLKLALQTWKTAVNLLSPVEPRMVEVLVQVGATYSQLYESSREPADIEEAVLFWRGMIARLPSNANGLVEYFNFLGYALSMRFECSRQVGDLNQSIQAVEHAAKLAHPTSEGRGRSLHNLGHLLLLRHPVARMQEDYQYGQKCLAEAAFIERSLRLPRLPAGSGEGKHS